jgi:hypothetical protein
MRRELADKIVKYAFAICVVSILPFLVSFVITWNQYDDNREIYDNNYSPSVGGGRVEITIPMM